MTVRFLAQELYRLTKKVEDLEKALAALPGPSPERARLEADLFLARKDRDHYRALLDSKKEKPVV